MPTFTVVIYIPKGISHVCRPSPLPSTETEVSFWIGAKAGNSLKKCIAVATPANTQETTTKSRLRLEEGPPREQQERTVFGGDLPQNKSTSPYSDGQQRGRYGPYGRARGYESGSPRLRTDKIRSRSRRRGKEWEIWVQWTSGVHARQYRGGSVDNSKELRW